MVERKPILGITIGDPSGIGPEIILKAFSALDLSDVNIFVIGAKSPLCAAKSIVGCDMEIEEVSDLSKIQFEKGKIFVLKVDNYEKTPSFGSPTKEDGSLMAKAIIEATNLSIHGKIDAIVTSPINKSVLNRAGFEYPGHTEMLASICKVSHPVMMMVSKRLKVALVTIHEALKDVPKIINEELIFETIEISSFSLKRFFGFSDPKVGVCALNPHGGEEGMFGDEEERIIGPAIKRAKKKGISVFGPVSADTAFFRALSGEFDVIISMYHDQGLIPIKVLDFYGAVNVTLGLPIIRTSVDHGVGYDIAGKGTANPNSMIEAINLAKNMVLSSWKER